MILSDRDIRERLAYQGDCRRIEIDPFSEPVSGNGVISYGLTSAGYDLRLGPQLLVMRDVRGGEAVDPKQFHSEAYRHLIYAHHDGLPDGTRVLLPPHGYALGVSVERLRIPRDLKARCVGKSTYARSGLLVNTTPLEPGWLGHLTIEIHNATSRHAAVYVGEGVCQLEFESLSSPCEVSYADKGGKYQGQVGVTVARVL